MQVGDKITNQRHGVDGTDIPVGALVRYAGDVGVNGVSGPTWDMEVMMRDGKKVLGFPGCPADQFIHGQNGTMTILHLK